MDDKYQISKPKKPETRAEILAAKIEELVKQRDRSSNLAAKQALLDHERSVAAGRGAFAFPRLPS